MTGLYSEEMRLGGLEVMVEGDTVPCSLALINMAHDYLGRLVSFGEV